MAIVKFLSFKDRDKDYYPDGHPLKEQGVATAVFDLDGVEVTKRVPRRFIKGTLDDFLRQTALGIARDADKANVPVLKVDKIKAGDILAETTNVSE